MPTGSKAFYICSHGRIWLVHYCYSPYHAITLYLHQWKFHLRCTSNTQHTLLQMVSTSHWIDRGKFYNFGNTILLLTLLQPNKPSLPWSLGGKLLQELHPALNNNWKWARIVKSEKVNTNIKDWYTFGFADSAPHVNVYYMQWGQPTSRWWHPRVVGWGLGKGQRSCHTTIPLE